MSDENGRDSRPGGELVYEALVEAGIDTLVGLPGTQTLPLDRAVAQRAEMRYVMARHETAIPHIAWGYYEATGKPAATLTVPGPGDTNAMHGLKNAANDNVPIVHISADVDPDERGKSPIHEIEADTFDNAVKANLNVERPRDLAETVQRGLELALSEPTGPVRLGIPSGFLDSEVPDADVSVSPESVEYDNAGAYADAVEVLETAERPVVYAGGGARRSEDGPRVVAELADALDAPVLTSYKGKGVYPEREDRSLGVTGSYLPEGARRVLAEADVVLALGTDFDGVTTDHWDLPMGETLIHVNIDSSDVDVAYESDVALVDDVTAAGDKLLAGLMDREPDGWDGADVARRVRDEYDAHLEEMGLFSGGAPANTPELLREIRAVTPWETPVALDVGGLRLWAMQVFDAASPDRLVAAGSWAGMGVGLPAAIGAALADPDEPVLCLTGDGGLMMCIHELHTAAEYGLDVTVVVSNNADYGIISKSPKIARYTDEHRFTWGSPDFATVAEGFGVEGVSVETAAEAADAVADALGNGEPTLVDVDVPTDEPSAVEASQYDSTVEL